jgi:hypothetical protein
MNTANKIDKFIKNNIIKFRAKGIPLSLDRSRIAVGNVLIQKTKSAVILDDVRTDFKVNLNYVYSAVLLAKYLDNRFSTESSTVKDIIDFDRRLAKYSNDVNTLKRQLKTATTGMKEILYSNRLDHAEQQYSYWLTQLDRLDKWDYKINKIYNFED